MNELDELYLRFLSNEALSGDPTALNAVAWDRIENEADGTRVGYDDTTGQQFVLGQDEPAPVAPTPAAPADASASSVETHYPHEPAAPRPLAEVSTPQAAPAEDAVQRRMTLLASTMRQAGAERDEESNTWWQDIGSDLGRLNVALDAPAGGWAQGIMRAALNSAGALRIVDQNDVDEYFQLVDELNAANTENNPAARILGGAGRLAGQYVFPAATGYRALRALKAPQWLAALVAESLTGMLALSPNDENLFNMLIAEDTSSPLWGPLRDLLAIEPTDSEWANRSRNVAEAIAGLGGSVALIRGLTGAVRQVKKFIASPQGREAADAVDEALRRQAQGILDEGVGRGGATSALRPAARSVLREPAAPASVETYFPVVSAAARGVPRNVPPEVAEPFYSAVVRAVDALPMEKAAGAQMRATIANTAGVKPEEMAWIGLDDFLAGKKSVTKQEVRDYVDANQVQVEEVVRADEGVTQNVSYLRRRYEMMVEGSGDYAELPPSLREERAEKMLADIEAMEAGNVVGPTKFGDRTLPGGENYREVVLTLPETRRTISNAGLARLDELEAARGWTDAERKEYIDLVAKVEEKGQFRGGHFDEPNVLAWVRLNDRAGPNGEKILFIEEIQSDWHQLGRNVGYRGGPGDRLGKVPDAPLKNTWHQMAFRRALKMAVDEGYDAVAWTPGRVQVARAHLGTQVDELRLEKLNNKWRLQALRDPGPADRISTGQDQPPPSTRTTVAYDKSGMTDGGLADLLGKELADRLIDTAVGSTGYRSLSGDGLEVGGAFLRRLYDTRIRNYASKFGKKFDAPVGEIDITTVSDAQWVDLGEGLDIVISSSAARPQTTTVWTLPVTPKMRESVSKGVPLFSAGGAAAAGAAMQDDQPASERAF